MKRLVASMLVILLFPTALAGCGQIKHPQNSDAGAGDQISVVATIFAPYDFLREIAGDQADITMLLPPAADSHSFEPTPQDIIRIQNCDIFVYVGGESDEWVDEILEAMDTGAMEIVALMDCVTVVEEELVAGMEAEEDEEEGAAYDEHVWTSPKNAKRIVQTLSDTLCEMDETNASAYRQNTAAYLEKLEELDAAFQAVVDNGVRKTIVFGDRFPFRYFTDAYGLDYFAAFPGCSTETEPSAATVTFLIEQVEAARIPVVFHVELSNGKIANTISEATGAKVRLLHACHNISKDDFEKGVRYLDLMTQNVETLKEALT